MQIGKQIDTVISVPLPVRREEQAPLPAGGEEEPLPAAAPKESEPVPA